MPSSTRCSPPPIPELGTASGFTFRLQDRGGAGPRGADRRAQPAAGHGRQEPGAHAGAARRPGRRAAAADRHRPRQGQRAGRHLRRRSTPRCRPRWARATSTTSRTRGRLQRVVVQADAPARMQPEDLLQAQRQQHPGPAGAAVGLRDARAGSPARCRRCATTAIRRCASPARRRRATAPARRWPRWKSSRRSCRRASATNGPASRARKSSPARRRIILYGFAILAVFLCLAALYESWTIPLSVILVVPLGVLGVLLATWLRGYAERRVLPGGPDHHHRPVGEERDPDHRVRQGPAGRRARA